MKPLFKKEESEHFNYDIEMMREVKPEENT